MNTGQLILDWLYEEHLQVDEPWSVKLKNGFTWWAARNAQHVEVIGKEAGPDGMVGYFVRVKTEFIRDVTLTDQALAGINLLMSTATTAGPVYDPKARTLSLSSLVRVHEEIRGWMSPLIGVAALQQIADAHLIAPQIKGMMGGSLAESGHPVNGFRPEPDELAVGFVRLLFETGERPTAWSAREFQQAVDQYMQGPPSLLATGGGNGLTVEFPYGDESSLCRMMGDQPHPRIGNGLFLLQSFPVGKKSDSEGTKLALELNAEELDRKPSGYGFGSYCYRDGCINFTGFLPNLCYQPGLLPNLYAASAVRARAMALRFMGDDWTQPGFKRQSSLVRFLKPSGLK